MRVWGKGQFTIPAEIMKQIKVFPDSSVIIAGLAPKTGGSPGIQIKPNL